jgi:transcriptional regulator NrdR family protein
MKGEPTEMTDGLRCPHCGSQQLRVTYTDRVKSTMKRRRACLVCDYRFSTVEVVVKQEKAA